MTQKSKGWIALYRSVLDPEEGDELWLSDEPYDMRSAWVWLLMRANFSDKLWIDREKREHLIKRGQLWTSSYKLSDAWRWSRGRVNRFLELLQRTGKISCESHHSGLLLTIEKYSKYQNVRTTDDTTFGTTVNTTDDTTDEAAVGTRLNNVNHINNDNNVNKVYSNTVPSLEECISYGHEVGQDGNKFYDYYTARGWKANGCTIVDWRAQMRSWKNDGTAAKKKITGGENGIYDC